MTADDNEFQAAAGASLRARLWFRMRAVSRSASPSAACSRCSAAAAACSPRSTARRSGSRRSPAGAAAAASSASYAACAAASAAAASASAGGAAAPSCAQHARKVTRTCDPQTPAAPGGYSCQPCVILRTAWERLTHSAGVLVRRLKSGDPPQAAAQVR